MAKKIDMEGLPKGAMMHCPICNAEYSATYGDYFLIPDDHEFYCCGLPCELVTKKTIFEPINQ